jgi:hypothetical protein
MQIKNKCITGLIALLTLPVFCQNNDYTAYYNIRNQALEYKVEGNYRQAIALL